MKAWLGSIAVITILSFPALGAYVSADGVSVYRPPSTNTWGLLEEDVQFAIINFDGQEENLIIQVGVLASSLSLASNMAWIFPIPASEDEATIGVYETFPALGGYYVEEYAKGELTEGFAWLYSSQIYGIPLALSTLYTLGERPGSSSLPTKSIGDTTAAGPGVNIYERVERYGLTTDLVGSKDSSALSQYLSSFGAMLPVQAQHKVNEYIDGGYTFVVSHLSNVTEFRAQATTTNGFGGATYGLSVGVSFLTTKMYFPMELTSIYGSSEIPIVLQIVGQVEPDPAEANPGIWMDVGYCLDKEYSVGSEQEWFFHEQANTGQLKWGSIHDLVYTMVLMDGQAGYMTSDLWFKDVQDSRVAVSDFLVHYSWGVLVPLFFGLSALASVLSGAFIYKAYRPRPSRFALLGLTNVGTLIGFAMITRGLNIEERDDFITRRDRAPPMKWRAFVVMFTLLFSGLCLLSHFVMNWLLWAVL